MKDRQMRKKNEIKVLFLVYSFVSFFVQESLLEKCFQGIHK